MEDKALLLSRFQELSARAYQRDILQHTGFLSLSEQAQFWEQRGAFSGAQALLWGGHDEAERAALFFLPSYLSEDVGPRRRENARGGEYLRSGENMYGKESLCGREAAEPHVPEACAEIIACISIRPRNEKFSDALSHRDYLGALMNLGIERDRLGDILTDETAAYCFCMADIADFICENLTRVRHTAVFCEKAPQGARSLAPRSETLSVNVASERLDAVISAVWKLSRGVSSELVAGEKVFVDGRTARQAGAEVPEGARISVRGYGKFIYEGAERETKKGRLYVKVRRFI